MTTLTDKDFTKCVFNPAIKGNLFKAYPALKELTNGEEGEEKERLLRYILAMYDQNSPLIRAYPDLGHRKQVAALIAGIKSEKILDELFANKIDWVLPATAQFLRLYGQSRLWAMIVATESQFWEFQQRLIMPVSAEKDKEILQSIEIKSKISAELDLMDSRLASYYSRLYGDDDELQSLSRARRITPTTIANVL